MTYNEAKFVLENRHLYNDEMVRWAMDVVEEYERQHPR